MAIGVIRAFEKFGFKVPADVGIAGFDDIPFSGLMSPRLTTIRIPAFQMGQRATRVLFNLMEGRSIRKIKRIAKTRLIKDDSCEDKR